MMTIPLLNIPIPANVEAVFMQMQSIISFNIINVNDIPLYSTFLPFKNDVDPFFSNVESDGS